MSRRRRRQRHPVTRAVTRRQALHTNGFQKLGGELNGGECDEAGARAAPRWVASAHPCRPVSLLRARRRLLDHRQRGRRRALPKRAQNDFTNRNSTFITWNPMHLAWMLRNAGLVRAYGNGRRICVGRHVRGPILVTRGFGGRPRPPAVTSLADSAICWGHRFRGGRADLTVTVRCSPAGSASPPRSQRPVRNRGCSRTPTGRTRPSRAARPRTAACCR